MDQTTLNELRGGIKGLERLLILLLERASRHDPHPNEFMGAVIMDANLDLQKERKTAVDEEHIAQVDYALGLVEVVAETLLTQAMRSGKPSGQA